VCPRGDEAGRLNVVGIGRSLEVWVDWHCRGHTEQHDGGHRRRLVCRGLEGHEGPHGMSDQVEWTAQLGGQFRDPCGQIWNRPERRALGLSVAGKVDRQGPVAVVGKESGLLRPDGPVHPGPMEKHHEWICGVRVYGNGAGGGIDASAVDYKTHPSTSALGGPQGL